MGTMKSDLLSCIVTHRTYVGKVLYRLNVMYALLLSATCKVCQHVLIYISDKKKAYLRCLFNRVQNSRNRIICSDPLLKPQLRLFSAEIALSFSTYTFVELRIFLQSTASQLNLQHAHVDRH